MTTVTSFNEFDSNKSTNATQPAYYVQAPFFVGYAPTSAPTLGGDMLQLRLKAICARYFSFNIFVGGRQCTNLTMSLSEPASPISDGTALCAQKALAEQSH